MNEDISYPYDEDIESLSIDEEEVSESILRSERDRVLSSLNRGIHYEHLELNNII